MESMEQPEPPTPEVRRAMNRRRLLLAAGAGAVALTIGRTLYGLAPDRETQHARAEVLPDGRPRLPPGQRLLQELRPMGGVPGDPNPASYRLRVHGEVEKPFDLDFRELLRLSSDQTCDVHCVTGWSMFAGSWSGVPLTDLATRAGVKSTARHVIFEGSHGYTANVPLEEVLQPQVMVAHSLNGDPLELWHGAPVRALVPSLYFWKSAKWLTGIRFSAEDEPGFWETRGYHNHGDPWREERYG
jgi:DMSO/TMAO reductase YedYZ molybdopterin-dependent catalytic subunit